MKNNDDNGSILILSRMGEGLDNNTEFQRRTEVAVFFVLTAFYAIINIPSRHFTNRIKVKVHELSATALLLLSLAKKGHRGVR